MAGTIDEVKAALSVLKSDSADYVNKLDMEYTFLKSEQGKITDTLSGTGYAQEMQYVISEVSQAVDAVNEARCHMMTVHEELEKAIARL